MNREPIRPNGFVSATMGVALISITACGSTNATPGSESALTALSEGSVLVLHTALSIPGDVWSVHFQDGELLRFGAVEDTRVYCELYLNGAKGHDWRVEPDRFLITQIDRFSDDTSWSALPEQPRVRLARDPRQSLYKTVLRLRSDRQPDVRELRCQVLFDAGFGLYPDEAEIRQALGDRFELRAFGH